MTSEEATAWIHSRLTFGQRPGLMRVEALLKRMGNPEKKERNDKFLLKQCRRHVGWLHEKIAGGVTKALSPYDGRKMASMAKNSVENEVQAIRINGTIIGGMAGLLFYLAVWAGGIF